MTTSETPAGMRDAVHALARAGSLYPSIILYGATQAQRQEEAIALARSLMCEADEDQRPCDACRPCRRIAWPDGDSERFHPDLHVLTRDRATATSVEATKSFLSAVGQAPFEARGQIFVVAEAESLHPGAADALLKVLEEPPGTTPRHFFLLAATEHDLLPTVRSRSLSVFLGPAEPLDADAIDALATELAPVLHRYADAGATVDLLRAAEVLGGIEGWRDARARRPWATAAAILTRCATQPPETTDAFRRAMLDTAGALLDGPRLRLRGIPHHRILEGLLSRHLGRRRPTP